VSPVGAIAIHVLGAIAIHVFGAIVIRAFGAIVIRAFGAIVIRARAQPASPSARPMTEARPGLFVRRCGNRPITSFFRPKNAPDADVAQRKLVRPRRRAAPPAPAAGAVLSWAALEPDRSRGPASGRF
jgi:hypothetical protein